MKKYLVYLSLIYNSHAIFYDSFHGTLLSKNEFDRYEKSNILGICTNDIDACDPKEGRRVDGSCNNLNNPSRGSIHTPSKRLLPAKFDKDFEPRKAASGKELPLARRLRTKLLPEGSVSSNQITVLATHYIQFVFNDIMSNHDSINYVILKPYCCAAEGKNDHECVPNIIPDDDPVHHFSKLRCINMTRPESFQSRGCIGKNTTPSRLSYATPLLDLSIIYGNTGNALQRFRNLIGGLLKYEMLNGMAWPPSVKPEFSICMLNQSPTETRCHDSPDEGANTCVGINMSFIWFWRLHNAIAEELSKVNPCWDDQKLFDTARDINIAIAIQIQYYEMMPLLLGKKNLEKDEIISKSLGFRDVYDKTVIPQLSLEYTYALRWMHTMQEGTLKLYDTTGDYKSQIPIGNLSLRTGYLAVDDHMAQLTQGTFRQASAASDDIVDPEMAEMGLGGLQAVLDLTTNDLAQSRYYGFQPYIKYREFCFGDRITCWNDLKSFMEPEKVERLMFNYDNVMDIDLMAGMWMEKLMPGSHVPQMFYCLIADQMRRNMVSDRHWYERPSRPNAFSLGQLHEIRKATIASVLCTVGDSVTEIQPSAFAKIGKNNKIRSCRKITKLDFSAWRDTACCDKKQ